MTKFIKNAYNRQDCFILNSFLFLAPNRGKFTQILRVDLLVLASTIFVLDYLMLLNLKLPFNFPTSFPFTVTKLLSSDFQKCNQKDLATHSHCFVFVFVSLCVSIIYSLCFFFVLCLLFTLFVIHHLMYPRLCLLFPTCCLLVFFYLFNLSLYLSWCSSIGLL